MRTILVLILAVHGLAAATIETRTVPGWGTWKKRLTPVFTGQYGIVGDPSVVRVGNRLRMLYGGFDPAKVPQGPATCAAESVDGITWKEFDTGDAVRGRVIMPGTGAWENTHETPFWLRRPDGGWSMWFIGYKSAEHAAGWGLFATHIGYATAGAAGLAFTAPATSPVLSPTPGGFDARAMTAPSVVLDGGLYRMVYAGWWNPTPISVGVTLLSATSPDGVIWTKRATPVFNGLTLPAYAAAHLAEPELVPAPDGSWLIFFSTTPVNGQPHSIGMARAPTIGGPWTISPQPIIVPTAGGFDAKDAVAPSVLIEGGRIRLWYAGFSADGQRIAIGYAESAWPLASGGGSDRGDSSSSSGGGGCGAGSSGAGAAGGAVFAGLFLVGGRSRRNGGASACSPG